MTIDTIEMCYDEVKKEMIKIQGSVSVYSEMSDGKIESVVRFVGVFSDNTAMTIKSTVLVAYLVVTIFINDSSKNGKIDNQCK